MSRDPDLTQQVINVVVTTLGIEDRADRISASTPLFGSLPELDSLAVVELATALEEEFDLVVDDDEFTGDIFETIGTLTDFVAAKR